MTPSGLKGKRILVTGADGFVGRHLCVELRRQGAEVATLADDGGHPIDVRDWPKIKDIAGRSRDIDVTYHLAALMFVPYSFQEPREVYEVNVVGTLNILELCRLCAIPRLVFASSYVYGQPVYLPINEVHPLNPNNPYARSKLFGENLCRAYHDDFGVSCMVLRPFNLYGEGQQQTFLIPSILAQLGNKEIELDDPEPKRDYLYISDAIDAYLKAGQYDKADFDIFNIGAGESHAVGDIVSRVLRVWGKEKRVKYRYQSRRNEIMDVVADIRKAKKLLKWEPKIPFEEGIERCLSWHQVQSHGAGKTAS